MHSTNYTDTLILVAEDCKKTAGTKPEREGTVAALQHALLSGKPYELTSDDVMWQVETTRKPAVADTPDNRASFFAKERACLRASPLVKTYGWGIHHDADGKAALVGCETPEYQRLSADESVKKRTGMRSRRK